MSSQTIFSEEVLDVIPVFYTVESNEQYTPITYQY